MASDVVTLRAGAWTSRWVPSVGMVGVSLFGAGRELLGQLGGLDAYATRGSSFGIPLLHPWANRLGGFTYAAAGREVALDAGMKRLRVDGHGLPIHGVLAAYKGWEVREVGAQTLVAELDFGADPELLGAFPFPHRLTLEIEQTARQPLGGHDADADQRPAGAGELRLPSLPDPARRAARAAGPARAGHDADPHRRSRHPDRRARGGRGAPRRDRRRRARRPLLRSRRRRRSSRSPAAATS